MYQDKIAKGLLFLATLLFIYMPFHIFLSQWLSSMTGGIGFWKLWKDFLLVAITIVSVGAVLYYKKQTKLFIVIIGLTSLYGLIHIVLLLAHSLPTDIELLASAYNLRIFAYLIIGYSLVLLLPKRNLFKRFLKILLILSTIVSVLAVIQRFLPADFLTHFGYSIERGVKPNFFIDDKPDFPRVFSTLRDPNSLGAFLILPIVLLTQLTVKYWRTDRQMLFSGLLLLHVLALLLTFSRSTLIATILAVISLVFLQRFNVVKKYSKAIFITAGVVILLLASSYALIRDTYIAQNIILHADGSTELADPNEKRIMLYQEGVDGIVDEPFGNGPGSAGLVSTRLESGGQLTENYFLQIGFEVGVMGLLVFVLLLLIIIQSLWDTRSKPYVKVLIASFIGLAFANLLFHTWANEAVAISWFMLAGLALAKSPTPRLINIKGLF